MPDNTPSWEEAATKALTDMVENTIMILTKDLPSLLSQEEVFQIRRVHKDQVLKNLPEALTALNAAVKELVLASKPDWSKEEHADNNAQMAYAIGGKKALDTYQANIIKAIEGKSDGQ